MVKAGEVQDEVPDADAVLAVEEDGSATETGLERNIQTNKTKNDKKNCRTGK